MKARHKCHWCETSFTDYDRREDVAHRPNRYGGTEPRSPGRQLSAKTVAARIDRLKAKILRLESEL